MKKLILIALLTAGAGLAEDPKPAVRSVNELGWLAGHWTTEAWGGKGEEFWTAPAAGNIFCVWRFMKDDKLVFSEIISIEQDAERGPVLRLKHFNPGLKGWEEKNDSMTMFLESFKPGDVLFEKENKSVALRYRKVSENELECVLSARKEGKSTDTVFKFKRVGTN